MVYSFIETRPVVAARWIVTERSMTHAPGDDHRSAALG